MGNHALIAHLSDLHFGNHNEHSLEGLRSDLLKEQPYPDFIIVSGDLSEKSKPSQLAHARGFLDGLVSELKELEHETRYIVIPGNHDVGLFKGQKSWNRAFPTWSEGSTSGRCQLDTSYIHHLKNNREDVAKRLEARDLRYCEFYPQSQLAFLKFDSNMISGNPLNYGRGAVGADQRSAVRQTLKTYEKAFSDFNQCRRIALVHHHVHYLPDGDKEKWLLMEDAGPFWRDMIEMGVELILHGHKHYATHIVNRYLRTNGEGKVEEREVMILAGGTAFSNDLPPNQQHCYYRIECDAFKSRAQRRAVGDGNFADAGPPLTFHSKLRFNIPGAPPVAAAALESMLVSGPKDLDQNYYHRISYVATIDRNLGYRMEVIFGGERKSEEPFLLVPIVIVGAPGRMSQIEFGAEDTTAIEKKILPCTLEPDEMNIDKLWLRVSLPAGEETVNVRLRLSVPGLMYPKNDFDAVGLARFVGGVKEFDYELRSERELLEPRFFAVRRSGLELLPTPSITKLTDGGHNYHVLKLPSRDPNTLGLGLLCHYRELRA